MVRPDLIEAPHSVVDQQATPHIDDITLALINIAVANEALEANNQDHDSAPVQANGSSPATDTASAPVVQRASQPPSSASSTTAKRPSSHVPRRSRRPMLPSRESSEVRRKATRSSAGRRRQRRWQNQCFIQSLAHRMLESSVGTELTHEEARLLMSEGRRLVQPTQGLFTDLLSNQESMENWDRFNRLEPSRQQKVLKKLMNQSESAVEPRDSAEARYGRVDRRARLNFKRQQGDVGGLVEMEADLMQQLNSHCGKALRIVEPDGYQRMLIHAICAYQRIKSESVDVDGERCVVASVPTSFTPAATALSAHLALLYRPSIREFFFIVDSVELYLLRKHGCNG
eukprot:TRINITY_DN12139_c0_g1_i13.p1 TRINITY_DN12139_c0_g1~~TRINITY_DN12139_c0_g1_i13.p1  ORF type:complete len:343 (+),score=46.38 TRINITY_DN12139_c0_g1_i13:1040-2068(+)